MVNLERSVPNPYKTDVKINRIGYYRSGEEEKLSIKEISMSCDDSNEETHYANDLVAEKQWRVIELFEKNLISKSTFREVLTLSVKNECMYSENEDSLKAYCNKTFGEYGYVELLIMAGRTNKLDQALIEKAILSMPDDLTVYDQMLAEDEVYFRDIEPKKTITIDDEMENTKVRYFGVSESLKEVKKRVEGISARGCSGLDKVYKAKYDHGILGIANKLRKDMGDEITDKFIQFCNVHYKTVEAAEAGIRKAYDKYQEDYCL